MADKNPTYYMDIVKGLVPANQLSSIPQVSKVPPGTILVGGQLLSEWRWRMAWNSVAVAFLAPTIARFFRAPDKSQTLIGKAGVWFFKRAVLPLKNSLAEIKPLREILETGKYNPDDIRKIAASITGSSLAYLLGMTLVGGLAGSLARMHFGTIAGLIYRFGGYQHVSNAIMGELFRIGLRLPLRYYYNAELRTTLPSPGEMRTAYQRRAFSTVVQGGWGWEKEVAAKSESSIDETEMDLYLALRGIPNKYKEVIKFISRRPLDPFSFAFLSQTGYFRGKEWEAIVRDMGYREAVKDFLVKAPMMWGLSPFKTSIRHRVMNGVSDGFIEEEKAISFLNDLWAILDMKAIMRIEAKTRYWYDMTKDKVDQAIDKFVKGVFTEEDLIREITTGSKIHIEAEEPGVTRVSIDLEMRVVNPERLKFYIEQAKIRARKKPREETLPDQRKYLYSSLASLTEDGFYTQEQMKNELEKAEQFKDLIPLMIYRTELEKNRAIWKRKIDILEEKYYRDEITREEFISEASKYIKDPSLLLDLADLVELRKRRKKESESLTSSQRKIADDLKLAFRKGKIDAKRFREELNKINSLKDPIAVAIYEAEFRKWLDEQLSEEEEKELRLRENIRLIGSTLINFYESGYWDYQTFSREMDKIKGLKSLEAAYLMKGTYEQYFKMLSLFEDLMVDKLETGKISQGAFVTEMNRMGIQDWKINYWLERYEIKQYGRRLTEKERWFTNYRACVGILEKIRDAGFKRADEVQRELETIKSIVSVEDIFSKRVKLETFYDERRIAIKVLAEQYKDKLLTDAKLYDELKKIIVVKDKLEKVFLEIIGKKKE